MNASPGCFERSDAGTRQHLLKLLLRNDLDAQGLGLGQLAAGILAHNQVVRLLADRPVGVAPRDSSFSWMPSRV